MGYLQKATRKPPKGKLTIICDVREKKPWTFDTLKYKVKTVVRALKTGDYTFEGYEDKIAIERKNGLGEICVNISASDRKRFEACLVRLSKMPVKYIVIEDDMNGVNAAIRALPIRARVTNTALRYWLMKIICEYKIPIIFLGSNRLSGDRVFKEFMETVIEVDLPRFRKKR